MDILDRIKYAPRRAIRMRCTKCRLNAIVFGHSDHFDVVCWRCKSPLVGQFIEQEGGIPMSGCEQCPSQKTCPCGECEKGPKNCMFVGHACDTCVCFTCEHMPQEGECPWVRCNCGQPHLRPKE